MSGLKAIERVSVRVKIATKIARHWLAHSRANGQALPEASKAALVIIADPDIREAFRQALPPDWRLLPAHTLPEAIEIVRSEGVRIVFCDPEVQTLDWQEVVSLLSRPPFRACVIVLSSLVCRNSWEQVAQLGGYEVLPKPLEREKVLRVAKAAWSHCRSQQALQAWYQSNGRRRELR